MKKKRRKINYSCESLPDIKPVNCDANKPIRFIIPSYFDLKETIDDIVWIAILNKLDKIESKN